MIKIVRGVYGFLDNDGIVRPKTEADEPFELLPEQEARLVKLGVAQYVGNVKSEQNSVETEREEFADGPIGIDDAPTDERPLAEHTVKELREIGKEYGLTFKVGIYKVDMVKAIEAAEAELNISAEDEDGESAPVFDASEAVQ